MRIISTPCKQIKCNNCDTVFEITNEDLNKRPNQDSWFNNGKYYICCPICGKEHHFKEMIKERDEKWK